MNILIFNWRDIKNPSGGGAEIVTLEHAKAWVKAGHNVTWYAASFPEAKKSEHIDGVHIMREGNAYSIFFRAPMYYLRHAKNIDVVIDEFHGIPFFTPFFVKKPIIGFIHEIAGEIWDVMYPFPINKIGKLIEKVMFVPYKNIPFFTVSESTKKELQHEGIKNVKVIHNGIYPTKLSEKVTKEGNPTYIFVSRLVKMKGIENVLEAFSYIIQKNKKSQLWIVGEGEETYVQELHQKTEKYGIGQNVTFHGRVNEERKLELLKRAHLLLHASIKEGWGLVVIEAASQNTPSVVYNSAGLRDSVKDGDTGVVIPINTPEVLAREATRLLADTQKYNRMQKNAFNWAKSLTWEDATDKSLALLKSI